MAGGVVSSLWLFGLPGLGLELLLFHPGTDLGGGVSVDAAPFK